MKLVSRTCFIFLAFLAFAVGSPAFAQIPIPTLNQPLIPSSVAPGGSAFTLTISGTGFASGATVNWNGSPRSTTFFSASQLTAAINAADISSQGTAIITVTNPGASEPSNAVPFPVQSTSQTLTWIESAVFSPANANGGAVVSGDFNNDGKLDAAFYDFHSGMIYIFLGNGDGTFQLPTTVQSLSGQLSPELCAADFNADGKLDLALLNIGGTGQLDVYLGNGDGTFQNVIAGPPGDQLFIGSAYGVGDFNGDGKLDLVVAGADDRQIPIGNVFLGNGDGTFQAPTSFFGAPSGVGNFSSLAVGDFNGDGKLDVAGVSGSGGSSGDGGVSIFLGNGDGTFGTPIFYSVTGGEAVSVAAADLNGDGKLDLAVGVSNCDTSGNCGGGQSFVSIYIGNGDGTLQAPVNYNTTSGGSDGLYPNTIAIGDFFDHGKLDVATGDALSNEITIFYGNGDGTFASLSAPSTPSAVYSLGATDGNIPAFISAGDFNGDGRLDFVTSTSSVFGSVGVNVWLQASIVPSFPKYKFKPQLIGTSSAPAPIRLTNTGKVAVPLTSVKIGGQSLNSFNQTNNCGTILAPGAHCTVQLTFAPQVVGPQSAFASVTNIFGPTNQFSGIGTAVNVAPASLAFGNQKVGTRSAPKTVTVTNAAKTTLTFTSISVRGGAASEFSQTKTCGRHLAAGASCTVSVTFAPKSKGPFTAVLSIVDSDPASPQKVGLSGTGT